MKLGKSPTKDSKRKASDIENVTEPSGSEMGSPTKKARTDDNTVWQPWTADECRQLVEHLRQDKSLLRRNFRMALKAVDWTAINVGDHDAKSIQQMSEKLISHVRKFRTLSEVLDDCVKDIDENKIGKLLIQHPKRPINPFMNFYMRHMSEIKETHPEASAVQLAKLARDVFKNLSDKKRKKYEKRYEEQVEDFKMQMDQLRTEHPELFPSKEIKLQKKKQERQTQKKRTLSVKNELPKPKTAKQIYMDTQVDGKLKKHPDKPREKLVSKFTQKWMNMSVEQREPWLLTAVNEKLRYLEELEALQDDDRFSKEEIDKEISRVQLRKIDIQLKLADIGKPKAPPLNGYQCFIAIRKAGPAENTMSMIERSSVMAREWKEMDEPQKQKYKQEFKKQLDAYNKQLDDWKKSLASEEADFVRKLEEMSQTRKRTKSTASKKGNGQNGTSKAKRSKKSVEKDERQTTIIQHFSPGTHIKNLEVDHGSDSGDVQSADKYESDDFQSEDDDHCSLEDFKLDKGAKTPQKTHTSANESKESRRFSNVHLSPPLISPMVNDTVSKKMKKKR